jgi:hypothetical protein
MRPLQLVNGGHRFESGLRLELQRRRFVRDRTPAIQRLRADWVQHDPVAESGVFAVIASAS